jgi:hypothetical protein
MVEKVEESAHTIRPNYGDYGINQAKEKVVAWAYMHSIERENEEISCVVYGEPYGGVCNSLQY